MSDSLVARVNPSLKLFLHLICMLLLIVAKDPMTTLYLLAIPVTVTLTVAKVPLKTFLVRISPFLLIFLFTIWSLAAYGKGETVWWQWGWIRITEEGLTNGLNIGLRMLGFVAYGLLFSVTTDVTQLMLSLMQQCKLPPKFAYAMLAGFRFIPMFKEEYEQIKAAHRVRGARRVPGLRGKVQAFMRYTIPLLSQGIRKAERVAVALEARGFDGSWNRTFYCEIRIGRIDAIYACLLLLLNLAVLTFVK
jgi:energy-coupling factor transport system permease protein